MEDDKVQWEWFNNITTQEWEEITPSDMDAVIAHNLTERPKFRKKGKDIIFII